MNDFLTAALANCPSITVCESRQVFGSTETSDSLSLLKIEHPVCSALIALQGAQLLQFSAVNKSPLLWLSPYANFKRGSAIRGGIPVCAPWFGVNQSDESLPKHGLVRTQDWQIVEASENSASVVLMFSYTSSDEDYGLFPYRFRCLLRMELSDKISLSLHIENLDSKIMPVSWALHSYHPVASLADVSIIGCDQCAFLDNTKGLSRAIQQGDVCFNGELDRVYLSVGKVQRILPDGISVSAEHAPTAIIWNPGKSLALTMADVRDSYDQYVCLERGAAFDNALSLSVGGAFTGSVEISNEE